MKKNPIFKMNDTVVANWDDRKVPLVRTQEYQVKDISREGTQIVAYRLASPSLREDVWVGKPEWAALSKAIPRGRHEDEDLSKVTFTTVPASDIQIGDLVICVDPSRHVSYGLGGKGVFEVLRKPGAANIKVLSQTQPAPNRPVYRHELTIPKHHIQEVKRVHYS